MIPAALPAQLRAEARRVLADGGRRDRFAAAAALRDAAAEIDHHRLLRPMFEALAVGKPFDQACAAAEAAERRAAA